MSFIEARDESDQGFKEFAVIHCQKCHLSDTGHMKYFTKHKVSCLMIKANGHLEKMGQDS